jgi:hypothetical protein
MAVERSLARASVAETQVSLEGLDAMARLARESNLVVHVVLPRGRGVVQHAREVARRAGVEAYADLRDQTVRIRFSPVERASDPEPR